MRSQRASRRAGLGALLALAFSLSVAATGGAPTGHAAGMSVSSGRVTTFRPSQLPPVCVSQTVYADVDTWVNEAAATTAYGSDTVLRVTQRRNSVGRTLVHFALPANPGSCTLASATLRLFNAPVAGSTGRAIDVYGAATSWSNTTTFNTVPGPAGTAVSATSATGWMSWSVKPLVDTMYAGANNGFLIRAAAEGGNTTYTQQFDSLDRPNPPELILQWQ